MLRLHVTEDTLPVKTGLVQRTPEWLEARTSSITATDASLLLGSDPYSSQPLVKLFDSKMGITVTNSSRRMRIGSAMEPMLFNFACEDIFGEGWENMWGVLGCGSVYSRMVPCRGVCVPFMASLDGEYVIRTEDRSYSTPIELKNTSEKEWRRHHGQVYPHHYDQLQAQMLVTQAEKCWIYYLIGGGETKLFEVQADKARQDKLVREAMAFINIYFAEGEEPLRPEPSEVSEVARGCLLQADELLGDIVIRLHTNKQRKDALENEIEEDNLILKEYIGNKSGSGITYNGITFDIRANKGRSGVDWEKVMASKGISKTDLDPFRTQGNPYIELRERKGGNVS